MKILYVSTISNTINAFLVPHIKLLIEQGHQVDVACNIKREINNELLELNCKVFDIEFQRSPLTKANYIAYKKLKKLIVNEDYDIVHTHTPVASTCTRLACKSLTNVKVLYTAHGFHFFKGSPLLNWLIYYPVEKYLSKYTDTLITINKEDYNRAKKSFKSKKTEYIPGVGLNINKIDEVSVDISLKRKEIGIPDNAFTLFSVGELNRNKNHETIIRAIAKLNNPQIYYVICGQGKLEEHLKGVIKELCLEKQVKLLGFRQDIVEICKVVDVFAFPSYREGLSVALMEAMSAGLPVVCSKIRGNTDLVEDGEGGYLIKPDDIDGFSQSINILSINKVFRKEMGQRNMDTIKQFDIENVKHKILEFY